MTSDLIHIARDYVDAGISVIPLRLDGSKAPAVASWNEYRERFATTDELGKMFAKPAGIGLPTGLQSGGFEVIDFDHHADKVFPDWMERIPVDLRTRLSIVETPSFGFHVLYRCDEISGNIKIAKTVDGKETIVESRGEGGYIVGCGSPLEVHSSSRPYVQTHGPPLPELRRITKDERKMLWLAAAEFDQRSRSAVMDEYVRKRSRELNPVADIVDQSTPWGDFDVRGDWIDILSPHGWTTIDGCLWTRAGKSFGSSAKVVTASSGCEVLTVFSANAGALSPVSGSHATHGKFNALALLNHNGDKSEAAKAVISLGFGRKVSA